MSTKKIDKATAIHSITKMVKDKEAVRAYLKGEVTLDALKEKGIKLAKPL